MKWLFAVLVLLLPMGAQAQTGYIRVTSCNDPRPPAGASQGYMDLDGNICVGGPAVQGFGSLSVSTSSIQASTATAGPSSAVWPTSPGMVFVLNDTASAGNLYVCPLGGVCTSSNGLELTPGRSWGFYRPSTAMTVIAASSATAQFQW